MAQTQICRGVKTKIDNQMMRDVLTVKYHDTNVVEVYGNRITLNTGGWKTVTTKLRMNQASNQFALGFQVYQEKGEWFVLFKTQIIPFEGDKLELMRD